VAISEFGVIKRGDKTREHCILEKNPLKIKIKPLYKGHLSIKGTYMFSIHAFVLHTNRLEVDADYILKLLIVLCQLDG
jgi:hypothetical protein